MKRVDIFVPIIGSIAIIFLVSIPLLTGKVEDIQTYLAGLAALVTSWISLYFSIIRQVLRKPIIKLEPSAGTVTFEPEEGLKTYLRLKVINTGQTIAKNCVGRILELRDDDNSPIQYDPLYFFWARQNDEITGYHPVNIYSGDAHFLDIARIRHKDKTFKLRVSTLGQPLPGGKNMPIKSYYIKVAIYADEMTPHLAWYCVKINPESLQDTYLERVKDPEKKKKK